MDQEYQERLIAAQVSELVARKETEGWTDVDVERDGDFVFVRLTGKLPDERYLAKVDLSRFPVDPYEVGFLDPDTDPSDRRRVSDRDPRYWPYSGMPGLHGSFNLVYTGAITVFWCRPCTFAYFWYHGGSDPWQPHEWPLWRVVAELRDAVKKADHPRRWRANERMTLIAIAKQKNITLPANAGIDHA